MKNLSYSAILLVALYFSIINAAPLEHEQQQVVVTPQTKADKEKNYRLPDSLKPEHYDIKLTPYLSEGKKPFTFDGVVEIKVKVAANTNKIILHAKYLNFTLVQYWKENGAKINLEKNTKPDDDTDIIEYNAQSELKKDEIIFLHFEYSGEMKDDMKGFYRSSYVDKNNETRWLGSTQFQTNHARRAFPSFDEPKFKATFQLTLTHHKDLSSFSNTDFVSKNKEGLNIVVTYEKTPVMSTYLVAFMLSKFTERENAEGNFSIVARSEYYEQTEYSHVVGMKLLKVLDNYSQMPYYNLGIKKMHMAAIPDFSAGAMENWGFLTFRERNLLVVENSTTLSAKQSIAMVIAHEQAHMWHGDLVTCDWWSYAWLNEGFARLLQYFATAEVEDKNELESQFVVDQIHSVMGLDATNNTNPMSDENTNTPADLSRQFGSITYNKGASVLRMISEQMGKKNFITSVRSYLNNNAYKTVTPQHLLDEFKKNWPKDTVNSATDLFESFTEQVGYPVITVNVTDNKKSLTITQKRFLLNETDGSNTTLLYTVPITYTTDLEKNFETTKANWFLTETEKTVDLKNEITWVIANIRESGYYRVNYNTKNWHAIHEALLKNNWSDIHEINRAQIVDDLFNLARANVVEYELALNILEYLTTETHYLPWTAAFNGYSYLAIRLGTDTKNFANYMRFQTDKVYKKLGFEEKSNDTVLEIFNRAKVCANSCKYGNKNCIREAQNYYNKLKKSNITVPANIRSPVYCTALREGDKSDYDFMFKKFLTDNVATEQTLILSSLGCVKDDKLIKEHFDNILSEHVRLQDKTSALSSLYSENNENVEPVFDLVTEHHEEVKKSLGSYNDVANIISNIAARFTTVDQEKKLKEFNKKNGEKFGGSAKDTLNKAEISVAKNLLWDKNKLGTFQLYLEKGFKNSAKSLNAFTIITVIVFTAFTTIMR